MRDLQFNWKLLIFPLNVYNATEKIEEIANYNVNISIINAILYLSVVATAVSDCILRFLIL